MSFFEELKRRNVFRVGIAYVLLGWVVLQAADFALDLIDAPNWTIQALFIAGLAGLPIALLFAWAFELTPEGIKREADVDRSASVAPTTGRKLDKVIIGFLVLAVALLLVDRSLNSTSMEPPAGQQTVLSEPGETASEAKSIAVLPFVNMSSDPEQDFFSDGISEDVLNALSKVKALKVAGRTSSFAFKGEGQDLRQIGETLGVGHILEGSVRKSGDKVRITTQLIQVEDGFNLWSETYDRELTDIFAIQDDIANQILVALTATLDIAPAKTTTPIAVSDYDKFLLARQLMRERREEPLLQAAALFAEVNNNAPDFAPAWTERAVTTLLLSDDLSSYGSIPLAQALESANSYLDRAGALDPESPELLAARGLYYDNARRRDLAIDYLQRALAINPNMTDASNWLWRQLFLSGRFKETLTLGERIRERDPLYLPAASNIAFSYLALGLEADMANHYEQVRRQLTAIDEPTVRSVETVLAILRGEPSDAVKAHRPADSSRDLWSAVRARSLLRLGAPERAARMAKGTSVEFLGLALAGRLEEAKRLAAPMIAEGQGIRDYIEVLAASGQHAELVRFYDERWPSREAFELQVTVRGLETGWSLGRMSEAFRATGDDQRADEFLARFGTVLEEATRQGANNHLHYFFQSYHATLQGDPAKALERLAAYAQTGHALTSDFTRQWPTFEFLRADPQFEALMAQMTERLDAQRAELDLPPYEGRLSG